MIDDFSDRGGQMITEAALREMTKAEIAALRRKLASLDAELPPLGGSDRRRRRFVIVMTLASVGLIPWIIFLGLKLPPHYVARRWTLTWVGFDIALLASLAMTAWLAWQRSHAVIVGAFVASALLTCDAWFDVTTASGSTGMLVSIASAVLLELPMAAALFVVAHRLLRQSVPLSSGAAAARSPAPSTSATS
jgi:hypothetical protein